mmetsp:Transcript_21021/g.40925  ORF Transcript_21021/g.40925 Transcript_21021/m.40925 type:complete len:301 (-) Transcript_21021:1735-2637(-)
MVMAMMMVMVMAMMMMMMIMVTVFVMMMMGMMMMMMMTPLTMRKLMRMLVPLLWVVRSPVLLPPALRRPKLRRTMATSPLAHRLALHKRRLRTPLSTAARLTLGALLTNFNRRRARMTSGGAERHDRSLPAAHRRKLCVRIRQSGADAVSPVVRTDGTAAAATRRSWLSSRASPRRRSRSSSRPLRGSPSTTISSSSTRRASSASSTRIARRSRSPSRTTRCRSEARTRSAPTGRASSCATVLVGHSRARNSRVRAAANRSRASHSSAPRRAAFVRCAPTWHSKASSGITSTSQIFREVT